MLHNTRAIILRTIKYGDTSIICQVFTEIFGLQSYLVKGVRSAKARSQKANILFPAAELDMIVYHQPHKNFQVAKEYQLSDIRLSLQQEVVKNCICLFAMEVIGQFLTNDDPQPELFQFCKNFLYEVSLLPPDHVNNLALFFLVQAGKLSGYQLSGMYSSLTTYLDLHEGRFSEKHGHLPPFIEGEQARLMSLLNQSGTIAAINEVRIDNVARRDLLHNFLYFFRLHAPHFKELKSLPVLTAILS